MIDTKFIAHFCNDSEWESEFLEQKYPRAKQVYLNTRPLVLGTCQFADIRPDLFVVNMIVKKDKNHIDLDALKQALHLLNFVTNTFKSQNKPVCIYIFPESDWAGVQEITKAEIDNDTPVFVYDKGPPEACSRALYTSSGTLIATGYKRIVTGERGPYVEFSRDQINWKATLIPKNQIWRTTGQYGNFYIEYRTTDPAYVKIYDQLKRVSYADYLPDHIYISPTDLQFENSERPMP